MAARPRLSLDGQWGFSTSSTPHTGSSSQIAVPSPWQADPRFRDHAGTAYYQREFEVAAEWLEGNRLVFIGFGAVDYFAEVWVNDLRVGEHEGGYLPFELEVTAAVHAGTNHLTVRVDDPLEIFAELPHGKQSWYGMLSGIWQSVWVESRAATHIRRVKITPSTESLSVEVTLNRPLDAAEVLAIEILDPDGTSVTRTETSSLNLQLPITSYQLWDIDSPSLYTLHVSTGADEVTETFGFRTLETRDGKILLNGRPLYLRGALDQDYYPDLIATPPSQEYIEDQLRKAREMGLNCLRVHIKVADPRYYAAADKVGLLVWTELPNHSLLSEEAKRRARETLAGMVERDWNHPSIAIWTIINESWGIDLTDPSQRAWLAETYDWLKKLDPTRLVVDNSACWGNAHLVSDLDDFHIYYAMPDHYRDWREWMEIFAGRPWWLYTPAYRDHAAWKEFLRDPWHAREQPLAAESRPGEAPLVVSEFGNWGLPDIAKLYEGNNGLAPWWFNSGLDWNPAVVYPRGIEKRFKEYHLDRIFPSLKALSEASQRLQFEALKYEIEQMRRHESIQGYVITEFTDVHWECNGLLDMYRNSKVYHDQLRWLNADDVLIPLWERLVFSPGETAEIDVLLSHYSPERLQDAVLVWELIRSGSSASRGQQPIAECASGVAPIGRLTFELPRVEHPERVRLELRLVQGQDLIARTGQDLYVFPDLPFRPDGQRVHFPESLRRPGTLFSGSAADPARADLAVTTMLDDACRELLLRGGRVLFLAEADDALQTHIPQLGIEPRRGTPWQGDWASTFGWHTFDGIPTDRLVDFAFADLTPQHVIQGLAPRDFAADVYAGYFAGWLHKPVPTIARRRVGRGELLVSTFQLTRNLEANPLARYLLTELIALLAGTKDFMNPGDTEIRSD